MSDKLVNRLRGQYQVGPNGEFGVRSFSDFVPPICIEAAGRIEELEKLLEIKTVDAREWRCLVEQCERLLGCEEGDTADKAVMSNLPNLIRDAVSASKR